MNNKIEKMVDFVREKNGPGWLQVGHVREYYVTKSHWPALVDIDFLISDIMIKNDIRPPNVWSLDSGEIVLQCKSWSDVRVLRRRLESFDGRIKFNWNNGKLFSFSWDVKDLKEIEEVVEEEVNWEEVSDEQE